MAETSTLRNRLFTTGYISLLLILGFLPGRETLEPGDTQWLYLGILNILGVLGVFWLSPKSAKSHEKLAILYLGVFLGFLLFCGLSLITAINIPEGVLSIAKSVTTGTTILILYALMRLPGVSLKRSIPTLLSIYTLCIAIPVLWSFLNNITIARDTLLLVPTKLNFGNRNVTAAVLTCCIPFCYYGAIQHHESFQKPLRALSAIAAVLSLAAILYIGSRTSFVALAFLTVLGIVNILLLKRWKELSAQAVLKKITLLLVVPFAVLALVLQTNRIDSQKANTVTQLLVTPESGAKKNTTVARDEPVSVGTDNARLMFYKSALNDFLEHPLVGVGAANWKLTDKTAFYRTFNKNSILNPQRVHNDFLQVLAEVGIFGFLCFVMLFVLLGMALFKMLSARQTFGFVLLASLGVYIIDATFNFPTERPQMQILFALLSILILGRIPLSRKRKPQPLSSQNRDRGILAAAMVLMIASCYVHYLKFNDSRNERYVRSDFKFKNFLNGDSFTLSHDTASDLLSGYFRINGDGTAYEHILAMYAMSEEKIDIALKHLDRSMTTAPYGYNSEMLKAIIYKDKKVQLDSALYYAEKGIYHRPSLKNNYTVQLNTLLTQKDTIAFLEATAPYLQRFPNDIATWRRRALMTLTSSKNFEQTLQILDTALRANPKHPVLENIQELVLSKKPGVIKKKTNKQHLNEALTFARQQKYLLAKKELLLILENDANHYLALFNLGFNAARQRQFQEAIAYYTKAIETGQYADGIAQYNRGLAYERLGNMDKAAQDYRKSKAMGYALALKLPAQKLNPKN